MNNFRTMNTSAVDKFYSKVVRQFIFEISQRVDIVTELRRSGFTPQTIEQCLYKHLSHTQPLFHRLLHSPDELDKQMSRKFQKLSQEEESSSSQPPQRPKEIEIFEEEQSKKLDEQNQSEKCSSINDDLEGYDSKVGPGKNGFQVQEQQQVKYDKAFDKQDQEDNSLKRDGSQLSLQDLSDIDEDYQATLRALRQKAGVHILATYKLGGKRYISNLERTEIKLNNVLIKLEGLSKQIMIKNAIVKCRKRQHR